MSVFLSTFTEVALTNTTNASGTIVLPPASNVQYRYLTFKDRNGTFQTNPLTVQTQGSDTFEDGTTSQVLRTRFGFLSVYSDGISKWHVLNATSLPQMYVSSLTVSSITGDGSLLRNLPAISSLSLTSSLQGLGTLGYISTASLLSVQTALATAGFVSAPNLLNHVSTPFLNTSLQSTLIGLGTAGYVSTSQLVSTVASLTAAGTGVTAANLTSSITGLATVGYVSTSQLVSTVASLTAAGTGVTAANLTSSITGLATVGYISTSQLVSTTSGLQRSGFISSLNLQSTVAGLGSAGYISTSLLGQFMSSFSTAMATYFYSASITTSSLLISSFSAGFGYTSSLTVDQLTFGDGTGWAYFGAIQAIAISSIQENVGNLYANNTYFGTTSSLTNLLFYGLQGNFNNTAIAEQSTGTGTQELLLYKVSSVSDRIRLQTTGNIVFETGVSTRLWPINTAQATPAMIINSSSNVGIQTASPGATLDVAGTGRFVTLSSQQLFVSSINNGLPVVGSDITSTVRGLGTAGYVSSSQLVSTVAGLTAAGTGVTAANLTSTTVGLGTIGYISSSQLLSTMSGMTTERTTAFQSTVAGLGTVGYVSSLSLVSTTQSILNSLSTGYYDNTETASTIAGLGTLGYVSSLSLTSTSIGLQNFVSTFFNDNVEIFSTFSGLGSLGYVSTASLTSTTVGLGTLGYVSTLSLTSTSIGLQNFVSTFFNDNVEIISSFSGLGSLGYVSTASLVSTTSGLQRSGFVSSQNLLGLVSTPNLLNLVSTQNLAGLVSTANLLNLVSTPNLLNLVSTVFLNTSLTSTVIGLGATGYISSTQLQSTLVSYANFFTSLSTNFSSIGANNISSVQAYISSLRVDNLSFGPGTGWVVAGPIQAIALSTLQVNTNALYANNSYFGTTSTITALQFWGLFGNYNNTVIAEQSTGAGTQELFFFKGSSISDRMRFTTTGDIRFEPQVGSQLYSNNPALATPTMILQSNLVGIGTASPGATLDVAGTGRFQLVSTLGLNVSSINGAAPIVLPNLTSTVAGLGTAGYVSSANLLNLVSTTFLNTSLASTVIGLGTSGYVSTTQLTSTSIGLQNFVSTFFNDNVEIFSSFSGLGSLGYVSTPSLTSTTVGLGTLGYVSSLSLTSTSIGLQNFVSTFFNDNVEIFSSFAGLGSLGYVSTASLTSTVVGLGTVGYVSSLSLTSTSIGLQNFVSTFFNDNVEIFSSFAGLGSLGYVSTASLTSTTIGLGTIGYVSTANLSGLVSTPNLLNLVSTSFLNTSLISTTQGLGTIGYVSTANLIGLVSTPNLLNLVSTPNLLNLVSTPNLVNLVSTPNLLNLVSTPNLLNLVSTPNLLNLVSTTFLNTTITSTVQGLGTIGYISSSQFFSTTNAYSQYFITLSASMSSLGVNNMSVGVAAISSLQVNGIQIGTGTGWVNIGPLQTIALSSIQVNTNLLYASNGYFGLQSSLTALQFYGLQGLFSNTVIAEQSTGAGTQELLLYKVSSSSDQIRVQTTGTFRVETGVSARAWPNNLSNATPALIIDTASNVGIQTNTPGAPLDVAGTGRFQLVSSLGLNVSSINGSAPIVLPNLTSTVAGLGTAGYVSTANLSGLVSTTFLNTSLASTVSGLGTAGYVSTLSLTSTSIGLQNFVSTFFYDNFEFLSSFGGLGSLGYVSTASLTSTTIGLGSIGYVSSLSLTSTSIGLQNFVSTFFNDNLEILSSFSGLGSLGYVSTASLTSTTVGLGTLGYLSTSQLTSTVEGLATSGYVSTTQLNSTIDGLGNFYTSTIVTDSNIASTLYQSAYFSTIAIGYNAGNLTQSNQAIAIGQEAGSNLQSYAAIGIGFGAAISTQGAYAVALGTGAGGYAQGEAAIAIGLGAATGGRFGFQGSNSIAIGNNAANGNQGIDGIAIGSGAAVIGQGDQAIAIGLGAGQNNQSTASIAIGSTAGTTNQGDAALALGVGAGNTNQGTGAIAIGPASGNTSQGNLAVAMGPFAGYLNQSSLAIAIGYQAGNIGQLDGAIAIGNQAGSNNQGNNSIAIGSYAGVESLPPSTIVLNALASTLNVTQSGAFYVAPIRYIEGQQTHTLGYNSNTAEIGMITGVNNNFFSLSTGFITASSINLIDPYTAEQNYLTVSSATLLLNGSTISGANGGVTQIIPGAGISVYPPYGTGVVTISSTGPTADDITSTTIGLGTLGYLSSVISSFFTISTGLITTSSTQYVDGLNSNTLNNLYVASTLLYYNSFVIGGTIQVQPQTFTF